MLALLAITLFQTPSLSQRPDSMEHLINRYMDRGTDKPADKRSEKTSDRKSERGTASAKTGETPVSPADDARAKAFMATLSGASGSKTGASIVIRAARADIASLMALHPTMALFSQARGQFLRALPSGANTETIEKELARRQGEVTKNHEIWGRDLELASKELAALERKFFNLRAIRSSDINLEGAKLQKALAGQPKIATANLTDGGENASDFQIQKVEEDEQSKALARESYERAIGEIELRFKAEKIRTEKLIQEKKALLEGIREKIDAPLYESLAQSSIIMSKLMKEISDSIDQVAASMGIALVVNDSFGPFKSGRGELLSSPGLKSEFSSRVYPTVAYNNYIQTLSRIDLSRDPNVRNIRNMEEALVSSIRDHLFDHRTSGNFYASFHNSRFAFGDIPDITVKTLALILGNHGISDEKSRIITAAYESYLQGLDSKPEPPEEN